ncbi:MAG: TraR/DksA family transcriptional regulator [Acidobacteria bacterium]|nr:TraR/DksA family transcriptional regulator [Acidobacteriota bacterium]
MKKANGPANGLENYRKLLLAKRSELLSGFRSKLDTLVGPGPAALDDLAPVFHEQFIALRVNRLDYLQLKLVDAALDRMNCEDYGVCMDCGDPISHKRLEAIPWAIRCIACQERLSSARDSAQFAELAA